MSSTFLKINLCYCIAKAIFAVPSQLREILLGLTSVLLRLRVSLSTEILREAT